MTTKEHFESLSHEQLLESVIQLTQHAGLDIDATVNLCPGHEGQCGICDHGVWIPCP